jgi:hypothetical protein
MLAFSILLSAGFARAAAVDTLGAEPSPASAMRAHTRWAMDGGLGLRLWDNGDFTREERTHLEKARAGSILGLGIAVFPWDNGLGVGVMHSRFHAKASSANTMFRDSTSGPQNDDFTIHYVGSTVHYIHWFGAGGRPRWAAVAEAGGGIFFYRDESTKGPFAGIQEGRTLGLHAAVSADYRILRWLAVGGGVRMLHGDVSEVHYNAMETSIPSVSMSRVDFLAGLRFYP